MRGSQSGLEHSVAGAVTNVSDLIQEQVLSQGDENDFLNDAGYQDVEKCDDSLGFPVTWHVATRFGERKALKGAPVGNLLEWVERTKASVRAKVEHPFSVVRNLFRHLKISYGGVSKKTARLFSLFDYGAKLMLARRWLFDAYNQRAS